MCCLGVFKRVVPFLITFALGLFVASFFVSLAFPSFPASRRQMKMRECHRVQMNYEELQQENQRLRDELAEARAKMVRDFESDIRLAVPPPPPIAPIVTRPAVTRTIK
jgi:hypothetical protein